MGDDCYPLIIWLLVVAALNVALAIPSRTPRVHWHKYGRPAFEESTAVHNPIEGDEVATDSSDLFADLALPEESVTEPLPESPLHRCGVDAESSRDPYIVNVITFYSNDSYKVNCQATLLSDKFVLVAASCVFNARKVVVLSSLTDPIKFPNQTDEQYVGDLVCPSKNFEDPNTRYSGWDFALVRLKKRVTLSEKFQTACLPNVPVEKANNLYIKLYDRSPDGKFSLRTEQVRTVRCPLYDARFRDVEFCYSTSFNKSINNDLRKLIATEHQSHHRESYSAQPVKLTELRSDSLKL